MAVVGVVIVLGLIGLAIVAAIHNGDEQGPDPPYSPGNLAAPGAPAMPSKADSDAENFDSPRAPPVPAVGTPAGRGFVPSGWWIMQVSGGMNVRNRIQFTADNRFNGTADTVFGTIPVTGTWDYEPRTSMLRLNFNTGDWVYMQLLTAQQGFSASLTQGFVQFHYQFTREP